MADFNPSMPIGCAFQKITWRLAGEGLPLREKRKESMQKEVQFGGYSTAPSDYECADGWLAASINAIQEDGGLRTLGQPRVVERLPEGYNVVYIHKISNALVFYILENGVDLLCSSNLIDFTRIATPYSSSNKVVEIVAMGKVLSVVLENDFFYLRHDSLSREYKLIPAGFPELQLSFALDGQFRLAVYEDTAFAVNNSMQEVVYDVIFETCTITKTHDTIINKTFPAGYYQFVKANSMMGGIHVYGSKSDGTEEEITIVPNNRFSVGFPNEYTSLRLHADALNSSGFADTVVTIYRSTAGVQEGLCPDNTEENLNAVLGVVNDFVAKAHGKNRFMYPFFVRYALRLFDGSHVAHSAPVLMIPGMADNPRVSWFDRRNGNGNGQSKLRVSSLLCNLQYKVNNLEALENIKSIYKDMVVAVDIFASEPIYTINQGAKFSDDEICIGGMSIVDEGRDPNFSIARCEEGGKYERHTNLELLGKALSAVEDKFVKYPLFTDEEVENKLRDVSVFYEICSMQLSDINTSNDFCDVKIEKDVVSSLRNRQKLKDDELNTHNVPFPSGMFVYNSRLNVATEKEYVFHGFSPVLCSGFTNGGGHAGTAFAQVHLNTDEGDVVVTTSEVPFQYPYDYYYFFYPDTRAYKAELRFFTSDRLIIREVEINLTPHDFLNGAQWMYSLDAGPKRCDSRVVSAVPSDKQTGIGAKIQTVGKVKTSEVNNPFLFSATSILTGSVIAFSSATKALSQGQFGQFPLYAFTSEGVWALEVSQTGSYSAKQPVTRDVVISKMVDGERVYNTKCITQLDSGVMFATERGIMLLSGSQAECVSDLINAAEPFDVGGLPHMDALHRMIGHDTGEEGENGCIPTRPFLTFLSGCGMIYDYVQQRIIVYNAQYTYAYVFSLKSKQWGMMYSEIETGLNSYPDALAMNKRGELVSFSPSPATEEGVAGLIVTRPLKLDMPDVLKTIYALILRGMFRRGDVKVVLYGSRDLQKWVVVGSSGTHELRNIAGAPYKYFRIAAVLDFSCEKSLSSASIELLPRQVNRLR